MENGTCQGSVPWGDQLTKRSLFCPRQKGTIGPSASPHPPASEVSLLGLLSSEMHKLKATSLVPMVTCLAWSSVIFQDWPLQSFLSLRKEPGE